jgi:acyl-CoA thioester hydrolase
MRVNKLGNSSVEYGLAIFREDEDEAAAEGHFIHVFVDRKTSKPTPIPENLRKALAGAVSTAKCFGPDENNRGL